MPGLVRALMMVATTGLLAAAALGLVAGTKSVSIKGMKFNPATIDVNVGDTVRWTNADDRDHTVSAADGSFKSGNLGSGDTFEHTFDKAGQFAYSCSYHPRMKGTVNVTQPK